MKERLEEEKKLEDLKLTFKPKINEYSRKLIKDSYKFGKINSEKNRNQSKQNIKINNDNEINTKKETKKYERNLTLINNINYLNKSKIKYDLVKTQENLKHKNKNITKKNPINNKRKLTPDKNLYDFLYLESKILKQKRDESIKKNMDLFCPFKPKLNDSYNKNIKSQYNLNVFQRLYNAKNENKKMATELKLRRKLKSDINDKTYNYSEKKPFKNIKNFQTIDNLKDRKYNDDNCYINSINKTINDENNDKSYFDKENKKNYIKKSFVTILKAKYIQCVELFNSLDSDKDGYISYKKIKLSNIETEKLISLSPIFYELQYKGLKMDFTKFCEKIQNLN